MSALTRWRALGTTVELVVLPSSRLFAARVAVERELEAIDRACSRFRSDSGLSRLNAATWEGPRPVAPLLLTAIEVALDAARRTAGAVDPTVGPAMVAAGYDRDLASVPADGPALAPVPAPGVAGIVVDRGAGTVVLPPGVALDLGATAKALAADRAAAAALRAVPDGRVLVSLGGDVAVAGVPPQDGWAIGIADDHRDRRPDHVVAIEGGAVATSGLTARRWRRGGRDVHHVLDPRTGAPVDPVWRTVSVAAPTCVLANTWSTAALVLGETAPEAIRRAGLAARLVAADGRVRTVGGWPAEADPVAGIGSGTVEVGATITRGPAGSPRHARTREHVGAHDLADAVEPAASRSRADTREHAGAHDRADTPEHAGTHHHAGTPAPAGTVHHAEAA